ncbi:MAG: DUF1566 domain-containing protein [Deltaproteobacteria bacterium]|nr:DUF1566 domain-containing protein [Deltaproteobacteria bacterium]MBN2672647.1 DUF1566 domain-containing protein [Deltaproteobacteria bacterium]
MKHKTFFIVSVFMAIAIGGCSKDSDGSTHGTDSGTDYVEDSDSVIENKDNKITDCTGQDNFTPCFVVTTSDRDYDICINEECLSPGCGSKSCNTPGPHFPLPDSGQKFCYDAGDDEIVCINLSNETDTESDTDLATDSDTDVVYSHYGQDAQYGWDVNNSEDDRFSRDLSISDEPVVNDNVTGLAWQGCPEGLSGSDCSTGSKVLQGSSDAVVTCDGLNWGGYDDWHLPDIFELLTLLKYEGDESYYSSAFPNITKETAFFWTLTKTGFDTPGIWAVNFASKISETGAETYDYSTLCVRGGSTAPLNRYTRDTSTANQPVVDDATTGLSWQGCTAGQTGDNCDEGTSIDFDEWAESLDYCETLNWGSFSDWRLPNINELRSIVITESVWPIIDEFVFPETPSDTFWTSTSDNRYHSNAWSIDFLDGETEDNFKGNSFHARCVRSK